MHSIIYDGKRAEAVLALAYQEGLIDVERDMDNVLGRIVKTQVSPGMRKSILKQMVMFPDIILDKELCFSGKLKFGGELIECGKIRFEAFPNEIDSSTWNTNEIYSDVSLVQKMLWDDGYQYSLDDMYRIFNETEQSRREYDAYWKKQGKEPVYNSVAMAMQEVIELTMGSQEAAAVYRTYREAKLKCAPIYDKFMELYRLVSVSSNYEKSILGIDMIAPVFETSDIMDMGKIVENPNAYLFIFKLASNKLHIIPHRSSLSETMRFAREPETIAFSDKVLDWVEKMRNGELDSIDQIYSEIEYAERQIKKAKSWSKMSGMATYVGFTASVIGEILGSIPESGAGMIRDFGQVLLSGLGITATYIGALAQASADDINDENRFVCIGNK